MHEYTLWHALIGGILIGLASLLATALSGKIPGISGVFGRLLVPATPDKRWRSLFLLGLIGGAALSFLLWDSAAIFRPMRPLAVMGGRGFDRRVWDTSWRRVHQRSRSLRGRDGRQGFHRGYAHLRGRRDGDRPYI